MNPPPGRRSQRPQVNLLVRAPASARLQHGVSAGSIIDPVAQLEALAQLCERGWLTPQELAQHKAEVLAYYRED
jgi:hypothetical protein